MSFGIACTCSACNIQVEVGLTVRDLDQDGFVTDNQSFISEAQAIEAKSLPQIAKAIVTIAQQRVGERLVQISGKVTNRSQAAPIKWPLDREGPSAPASNASLQLVQAIGYGISAQLVDNAVCGGYNGAFECDITVGYDKKKLTPSEWQMVDWVRNKFSLDTYKASCEELALGIISVLRGELGRSLQTASARVYNRTGHAETVWNNTMQIPPFPRVATRAERQRTERRYEESTTTVRGC